MAKPVKFRVLTVGDGDLTLSLALARAYGHDQSLELVASTLLSSKEELICTYSNSQDVLQELKERNVAVLFGVDATKLTDTIRVDQNHHGKWDAILFHHPHLGDSLLESNEQAHAHRHHVLLSHYFSSAKSCLGDGGIVHVCLCGRQPLTWKVMEAAGRQGLELRDCTSTNVPIHSWLPFLSSEPAPVLSHYPAPRRFRNGKLGSKHFLGRYGYRHRRTHGDLQQSGISTDVNVSGSMHFVFATSALIGEEHQQSKMALANDCQVCGMKFDSIEKLYRHHTAPALPDPIEVESVNMNVPVLESKSVEEIKSTLNVDGCDKVAGDDSDAITPQSTFCAATYADIQDIVASFTIDDEHDGNRLKWYLRQYSLLSGGRDACRPSKQQVERMIKSGRVALNGEVVLDSSRFLHTGDTLQILRDSVVDTGYVSKRNLPRIEIHYQADNLIVAFKPVGMRTIGSFSDQTLEMTVSLQVGQSFKAVSKLDSGCCGLSVLKRSHSSPQEIKLTHVFTALVHGHVPESWNELSLDLPVECMRRWKKCGSKGTSGDDSPRIDTAVRANENSNTNAVESYADSVEIHVLERTTTTARDKPPTLSSLKISTTSSAGGLCNTICFLLRKQGYPVVNDRLCRREYLALPRSIRNLIKRRLCIGCYAVSWAEGHERVRTLSIQEPDRLHASHWQSHRDPGVSAA